MLLAKEKANQSPLVIEIETTWVNKQNQDLTAVVKQVSGGRVWFIVSDKKNMNEGKGGLTEAEFLNTYEPLIQTDNKGPSFDLGVGKDKGVFVLIKAAIKEGENTMSLCDCPKCVHIRNIDENKIKRPAIFEGFEVNSEHVLNTINGLQEKAVIKKTWQEENGKPWVTYLSDSRLGFLDMQLKDFQRMFKPPQKAGAPSDGDRFFYITYSYFVGGRRGHKKDFIAYKTINNQSFNVHIVVRDIERLLAAKGIKTKHVLIDRWNSIDKDEYQNIIGGENEKA